MSGSLELLKNTPVVDLRKHSALQQAPVLPLSLHSSAECGRLHGVYLSLVINYAQALYVQES